jgi:NAD(P)H-hydrate epimerase
MVAGSRGMTGAAYLCALGALKAGAGLVTVGAPESVRRIITSRLPEAMTLPLPETKDGYLSSGAVPSIAQYVRRRTITTLAAGPGLSVHPPVRVVIKSLLMKGLPLVLDADGLNNIKPADLKAKPVVITPHPGELARFLGISTKKVQANRTKIAQDTARRLKIICVLKGHRTVISDGHQVRLNPTGNPAMATGGMGDVLTGVISAFLAQGLSLFDAACAGVYVHGLAGDLARVSDRGLLASEVANFVPKALKKIGIK